VVSLKWDQKIARASASRVGWSICRAATSAAASSAVFSRVRTR
jgi:hypothetical protein